MKTINKKLAHTFFFFFDLLCIEGIWFGFHEFQRILMETAVHADMIRFSNRVGFFIVVILIPAIHSLAFIDRIWPDLARKYSMLVNKTIIASVIILLSLGFIGSSWIKTQVENAGYYYCRQANSISALYRTLVYTRNAAVCEELVAAENDSGKQSDFSLSIHVGELIRKGESLTIEFKSDTRSLPDRDLIAAVVALSRPLVC